MLRRLFCYKVFIYFVQKLLTKTFLAMKLKSFLILLLAAVLGGVSVVLIQKIVSPKNNQTPIYFTGNQTPARTTAFNFPAQVNTNFSEAAEKTIDAVVHVKTISNGQRNNNNLYGFFFGNPHRQQMPVQAAGSGVIISSDGYIVTNNHVIKNADKISVTLNNNREYSATLIGADPSTDIALLKIDEANLPHIAYGNSDDLNIGEWVLAVGNPFNLTSTVTAGIVSAKARNINILREQYAVESFIQTDAAVNPGNSGGALVNIKGELVGINTAIASHTGSFSGYSFAVPVNIVKKIVMDLMEYGTVQRAVLGVSIANINNDLVEYLNLQNTDGVYINDVFQNSSAMDAGIQPQDIILEINQHPVNTSSELQEQISKYRPGDNISVTLKRNGEVKTVNVLLKNRAGNTDIVQKNDLEILGATFENIDKMRIGRYMLHGGVRITSLKDGKLKNSGIKNGFIILRINRNPIHNTEDLINQLDNTQGGVYIEGIYPNGSRAYYAFGL